MSPDRRFHTDDRTSENFTEGGLSSLTGQSQGRWGRYVLKELLDNALEATEEAESNEEHPTSIAVEIFTEKGASGRDVSRLTVRDTGPGISESRLSRIFEDPDAFGGTKRHYARPTRGNQGNALMTILGIQTLCERPLRIASNGQVYHIQVKDDTFTGRPEIDISALDSAGDATVDTAVDDSTASIGTSLVTDGNGTVRTRSQGMTVTVDFGYRAFKYANSVTRIVNTVYQFVALNPQTGFTLIVGDEDPTVKRFPATDAAESTVETLTLRGDVTSGKVRWFSISDFVERLKADVRVDPTLSIADFVNEFYGLASTAKTRTVLNGFERADGTVRDLFDDDGHARNETIRDLYNRMVTETRPFSPNGLDSTLGSVGPDLSEGLLKYAHSTRRAGESGPQSIAHQLRETSDGEATTAADLVIYNHGGVVINSGFDPDSAVETSADRTSGGKTVPFHFELAAVPHTVAEKGETEQSAVIFGINQSVTYSTPMFSPSLTIKYTNRSPKRHRQIRTAFEQFDHGFCIVANLTCPNISFQDKGKQQFNTEPFTEVIEDVVGKVVRKIEREIRPKLNSLRDERTHTALEHPTLRGKAPKGFIKNFVFSDFDEAYAIGSEEGKYTLTMRQLFYVMRPRFLDEADRQGYQYTPSASVTDRRELELKYNTFTSYVDEYEREELGQRIIYRDDRGFFSEPHSNETVDLGTHAVEKYVPDYDQYGTLLFIEKSGFYELLHKDFAIDKRYDIGLINAQGWSTGALRDLIETIQTGPRTDDEGRGETDLPLYTLTDLDIAGLGIAADAGKADELSTVDAFDAERIGVTLDDVDRHDLPVEAENYADKQLSALKRRYNSGEVTRDLYEFLTENGGQRVEINAFRPAELRTYLETKLDDLGVEKIQPSTPDEIDVPTVTDETTIRENAINTAIGEHIRQVAFGDVLDAVERAETEVFIINTDTNTGTGASEGNATNERSDDDLTAALADLPTGEDARDTLYNDICKELETHPPEPWRHINQRLRTEIQDEIDTAEKKRAAEIKTAVQNYLTENIEISISITTDDTDP